MSRSLFIGKQEYFPGIGPIPYEGPGSDNPLSFKAYDAGRVVGGKTLEEHLQSARRRRRCARSASVNMERGGEGRNR